MLDAVEPPGRSSASRTGLISSSSSPSEGLVSPSVIPRGRLIDGWSMVLSTSGMSSAVAVVVGKERGEAGVA